MKAIVTGGTGFLGTCLVQKLVRQGHDVRIVSRRKGHDIAHIDTLRGVFRGAQAVFHLAALVQSRPGPFEQINIQGLRNVLQLCEEEGIERLLYVSSFTIFGPSGEGVHTERTIPRRLHFFHGYDSSKYHAYELAEKWKARLPMNIVFPTVIYGPGPLTEGNIMARLFQRWQLLRLAPLPDYGQPRWNFAFVEDVAEAITRCLRRPQGENFILGGSNCSLRELHAAFVRVTGRHILRVGLPATCFKASAYLEDWASRLGRFPPLVLPVTADFFLNNWQFSDEKARQQMGYSPRSLQEGLRQWLRGV